MTISKTKLKGGVQLLLTEMRGRSTMLGRCMTAVTASRKTTKKH